MTNEARSLSHYNRSVGAFAVSAHVVLRTYIARLRRQALLTNGASLIAQMLNIAIARKDATINQKMPLRGTDHKGIWCIMGVRAVRSRNERVLGPRP